MPSVPRLLQEGLARADGHRDTSQHDPHLSSGQKPGKHLASRQTPDPHVAIPELQAPNGLEKEMCSTNPRAQTAAFPRRWASRQPRPSHPTFTPRGAARITGSWRPRRRTAKVHLSGL